jgi:hypothetical protein
MPISPEELRCRFTYHKPQEGQPQKYEKLRDKGLELAELVVELTPESREQSLAVTKIEEAIMHANAAIARREGHTASDHGHDGGFSPGNPPG